MQRRRDRVAGEQHDVALHVGRRDGFAGAEEAARIGRAHREQAAPAQHVVQAGRHAAPLAGEQIVDRDRLRAAIDHAGVEVILQVGADARHVGDHRDAMLPAAAMRGRGRTAASVAAC